MKRRGLMILSAALSIWIVSEGAGDAADPPSATLWRFLGIPQGLSALRNGTVNRRGNRPGLEKKPPMKTIGDPSNLESKNPAIKKAAQIKQEEDLKKQKIKALKYLATVGCGCYPGVKEALMDALDDCTEKVRLTAAQQIAEAAENKCEICQKTCCCDEEMGKKLAEIAYERDESGCFVEPSERVRKAAAEALRACCAANNQRRGGQSLPMMPVQGQVQQQEVEERGTDQDIEKRGTDPDYEDKAPTPESDGEARLLGPSGSLIGRSTASKRMVDIDDSMTVADIVEFSGSTQARNKPSRPIHGSVVGVDLENGTVDLEFSDRQRPEVGSRLRMRREYLLEVVGLGEVQVVSLAKNGHTIARPIGNLGINGLAKGDTTSYRLASQHTGLPEDRAVLIAPDQPHAANPKVIAGGPKTPAGKGQRAQAVATIDPSGADESAHGLKVRPASKSTRSNAARPAPKRCMNAVPARNAGVETMVWDDDTPDTAFCTDADGIEPTRHVGDDESRDTASRADAFERTVRLPVKYDLR